MRGSVRLKEVDAIRLVGGRSRGPLLLLLLLLCRRLSLLLLLLRRLALLLQMVLMRVGMLVRVRSAGVAGDAEVEAGRVVLGGGGEGLVLVLVVLRGAVTVQQVCIGDLMLLRRPIQ
jgi:hypothetical protein